MTDQTKPDPTRRDGGAGGFVVGGTRYEAGGSGGSGGGDDGDDDGSQMRDVRDVRDARHQ